MSCKEISEEDPFLAKKICAEVCVSENMMNFNSPLLPQQLTNVLNDTLIMMKTTITSLMILIASRESLSQVTCSYPNLLARLRPCKIAISSAQRFEAIPI